MKKIYFKGYYGFKNLGDDIFCATADWICNNLWKDKKAIFLGRDLPAVSKNSVKIGIRNYWLRKLIELFLVLGSDYIVYFGGSLFSRVSGLRDIKYMLGKCSIFYPKLGTVGTSVGPFSNEKDYNSIRHFLSKFKFITVRDFASLKVINRMEIGSSASFSFDLAILVNDVFRPLKSKGKRDFNGKFKIAVSLCHYERYIGGDVKKEEEREESILGFIGSLIDKYRNIEEILFFEFNGNVDNGDSEISTQFYEIISHKIKSRIVHYTPETKEFIRELNECDFLIGIRLHSGILAYALNIPFMLVEYHAKCSEFLDTINHNYRFDVKDQLGNIERFNAILEQQDIPNIKEPIYFRNIMIRELKKINRIL